MHGQQNVKKKSIFLSIYSHKKQHLVPKLGFIEIKYSEPSGSKPFLKSIGLQPLACWDCGFESQWGHGCLSVVSVVCCQVERGLCDELITRPEESYRLWRNVMCDPETSWMRRPWPSGGCRPRNKQFISLWMKFRSFEKLCCVNGFVVPNVKKAPLSFQLLKTITQWHNVTSHITWILWNTTVATPNSQILIC